VAVQIVRFNRLQRSTYACQRQRLGLHQHRLHREQNITGRIPQGSIRCMGCTGALARRDGPQRAHIHTSVSCLCPISKLGMGRLRKHSGCREIIAGMLECADEERCRAQRQATSAAAVMPPWRLCQPRGTSVARFGCGSRLRWLRAQPMSRLQAAGKMPVVVLMFPVWCSDLKGLEIHQLHKALLRHITQVASMSCRRCSWSAANKRNILFGRYVQLTVGHSDIPSFHHSWAKLAQLPSMSRMLRSSHCGDFTSRYTRPASSCSPV